MKIKTSITISEHLLREIHTMVPDTGKRSQFIEEAVASHIEKMRAMERNQKDLSIIDRNEKELNKEASEVLSYQVPV